MSSKKTSKPPRPSSRSPCRSRQRDENGRDTAECSAAISPACISSPTACCRPNGDHRRRAHRLRRRRSGTARHPRPAASQTAATAKKSSRCPRRRRTDGRYSAQEGDESGQDQPSQDCRRGKDAAAYRQAVLLAGKLIDGKLWDGDSLIRIDDVYALAKKMKHLTERDLSMFTLTDFVLVGDSTDGDEPPVAAEEEEPLTLEAPASSAVSTNGASHTTALL